MWKLLFEIQLYPLLHLNPNKFPIPMKPPQTLTAPTSPFSIRITNSLPSPLIPKHHTLHSPPHIHSLVAAPPPVAPATKRWLRPTPELGIMSNLFVFTMAFGAFISVALVSIPTLIAFRRLGASVNKLSKVVSEEVPGTLSSLKLSSLELNDLTQKLSNLRRSLSCRKQDGCFFMCMLVVSK
ncbi:hypothetical protein PIB30_049206 [Stylosanthes scabra]|uniref:Uncharacterized protein n=2 Tax=Stylosanthes scabra TaxID=79078 RepID=A0ABU6XIJ5_9FABA|nr:hypothetical protein [Stylosanthes scabra]